MSAISRSSEKDKRYCLLAFCRRRMIRHCVHHVRVEVLVKKHSDPRSGIFPMFLLTDAI